MYYLAANESICFVVVVLPVYAHKDYEETMMSDKQSENAPVQESTLTPDPYKNYDEGRQDVRTYAGLLVQVVTLLLTTLIIVLGWLIKDYATEKYHLAVAIAAPQLTTMSYPSANMPASAGRAATQKINWTERQMDKISDVYWHMLLRSPTASLLLLGMSAFTLLTFGLLLVLGHQLQRRRYRCHELALEVGLEEDQPVVAPRLVADGLNALIITVGISAYGMFVAATYQVSAYMVAGRAIALRVLVGVVWLLVLYKAFSTFKIVRGYADFEHKEGWKARWSRASVLVARIRDKAKGHSDNKPELTEIINGLVEICKTGGKSRWRDAEKSLTDLLRGTNKTTLGGELEDTIDELVKTLRYDRLLKLRGKD
jgi:hypothetical protein